MLPDYPDLALPDGAWTNSRNLRYRDAAVEKCKGYEQVLGSLSATPIFAATISDGSNIFWVYGGNTVLYATDGTTQSDIGHASLVYNAGNDLGWTGGAFHGFMVLTEGTVVPQAWQPSLANNAVSLTAWPAGVLCRVIRPFKDFLFALRITDGGNYNPRLLRWSDRAAQGALPGSWDFTDPTNQAGINELGQTQDLLVDCLGLRDSLVIYKEFHTWLAEYIGGDDIFAFRQVFSQIGMLTENCALTFGANQLVVSDSDIVVHDGNSARSIADKRMRKWFFNRLNANRFKRTFVAADYRNREAFICFPESGFDWPNLALVWNWADDSFHVRELGNTVSYGANGLIPGAASSIDSDSRTYDLATESIDEENYNPAALRLLLTDASRPLAYQVDVGETFNGTAMTCFAERQGLPVSKMDLHRIKRISAIYPKVLGAQGDTLRFFIGTRAAIDAPTLWNGPYTFSIGQQHRIDLRLSARILDVRVEYTGTGTFRLFGYDLEVQPDGLR